LGFGEIGAVVCEIGQRCLYEGMDITSTELATKRPPLSLPFYYGWFVVSLCFLTTLISAGVRSSPSVLIHPLEAEFGWSRALIASAISMNLLLFGVAAPISGFLLDRFGPRKVMLGSLLLLITGVSGTVAMTEFWQFFLVWGIIVGIGAGGVGSVLTATVGNRWFYARRGLALGILGSASSTGQLIFLPFFMAMIAYSGWRVGSTTLIVLAVFVVAADFSLHARRSRRRGTAALRRRTAGRGQLGRRVVSARRAGEKRDDQAARCGGSSDVLAFVRQLFRLRRHRQRAHRHASHPARN
jgi:MFS family permease